MENKLIVPQDVYNRIEADALAWSENQYGHDDVNKDYLEGALHEAMIAQAEYVRLKAQPGPRWVKASTWPQDHNIVHWRRVEDKKPLLVVGRNYQDNIIAQFGRVYTPNELEWLDEQPAAGREDDWISVDDRPLIKRDGEWWEITEDGEQEFIAAVPYHDAETDDPKKDRWWIRHCYIDGEGFLYVKCDNEMDEDVAGWNVSDITHWRPLPEPPKQQKEK